MEVINKYGVLLLLWITCSLGFGQRKKVYLLPGQGADWALFTKLELSECDTVILKYPVPFKRETLPQYAKRLLLQIDTTQPFYLVGVSFGGMNAIEIAKLTHPKKIILISSAKNRKELPFRYTFQRIFPMYTFFSGRFYKKMAQRARPLFEPDCKPYDSLFRAMIHRKDPSFMKRSIKMICRWKNKEIPVSLVHIHGTNDHTLPHRKIVNPISVYDGSHMMVYTRAKEISKLIQAALMDCP